MREELRLRAEPIPNRFVKLDHVETGDSPMVDIAHYIGRAASEFELQDFVIQTRSDYWKTSQLVLFTKANELILPTLFVEKCEKNHKQIEACFDQYVKSE